MPKPRWQQKAHRQRVHQRWVERGNRPLDAEWSEKQCGSCAFWVPLTGTWGLDWGVCSNPESLMDQRATFEHDGCEAHEATEKWNLPREEPANEDE